MALFSASSVAFAQADGSYSPYSIYGIGDICSQGSAYHRSMGGVGIASRNNKYLNILNPASVTARDSLSFMSDFSLYADNTIYKQGKLKSANNTVNIADFAISFPLFKNTGMMLGITPYSSTGFGFSLNYTDPELIGNTGYVSYSADGKGTIYKSFIGFGATFFRNLSLGVEMDVYFGNVEKNFNTTFNDASYNSIKNNTSLKTNGIGAKAGLQYEQNLGTNLKLTLGATYSTGAKMKGFYDYTSLSAGTAAVDTLVHKPDTLGLQKDLHLASEIGVGLSLRSPGKWAAEVNYSRSDWSNSGVDAISGYSDNYNPFKSTNSDIIRIGFELTPNGNDIRYYFNRATYRLGGYYKNDYYLLNGYKVSTAALSLGVTLPVYRWYNGLTLGVELGQRGISKNQVIKENFINFSVGFNIFDIWFQKPRYD